MWILISQTVNSLGGKTTPAPLAPYRTMAECGAFDRFMNRLCYALGLISRLE